MKKNPFKIWFIILFFVCAVIGFMIKLPRIFHHHDKELHAIFYFAAMTTISFIYPKRWHLVSIFLFFFGISIECLQDLSNKIIGKTIHGKFDIHDVKYNIIGILIGTLCFYFIQFLIKTILINKPYNGKQ